MKSKEHFLKAELNTDLLTPIQWNAILRAMDNYKNQPNLKNVINPNVYSIVTHPDSEELKSKHWFDECYPITDNIGLEAYGQEAYYIPFNRYVELCSVSEDWDLIFEDLDSIFTSLKTTQHIKDVNCVIVFRNGKVETFNTIRA
jgi:hypothetical protein